MIDVHVHAVPPRLPGAGPLSPVLGESPDAVAAQLRREMTAAGVTHALAMGAWRGGDDDPLGVAATLRIAEIVPGLSAIGIADPTRDDTDHQRGVETALATGRVIALKAYLGYLHYGPDHPNYTPYYEMAARYNVPFFFHTGDTYSPCAKLRFAHPLLVDDVAVNHPDVRFILAHVGNPWTLEAAEVVYKNVNVWADLSGLVVGDASAFKAEDRLDLLNDLRAAVQRAYRYAERPNRFLYGSDWPLVPMTAYRDFVATLVPAVHHDLVFTENARGLFGLAD
jgi:uncharacterized protein